LLYQINNYGEIFEEGENAAGTPAIRMREGPLPSREDLLAKRQLVKLVKNAGETGVYLRRLYTNTGYESKLVERILGEVPEIECRRKGRREILYKWTGPSATPEHSVIQEVNRRPSRCPSCSRWNS